MGRMAAQNSSQACERFDRVLFLLFFGIMFFTAVLFCSEVWFKDDSQLFQVAAGVLTGFTGAFFGRLKPQKDQQSNTGGGDDNSTNITNQTTPPVISPKA